MNDRRDRSSPRGSDSEAGSETGSAAGSDTVSFLLDVMLGKLAVYLRMCGYDAAYAGDWGIEADNRIRELAREENRTLLTRDVELAGRAVDSVLVRSLDIVDQLEELRGAGVSLELEERPSRCGRCNGRLARVPPDGDAPEYAPDPAEVDCWRCRACGQYFWKGSHWDRVANALD